MISSVSNILQQQHRGLESFADIMLSIEEMFASLGVRQHRRNLVLSWIYGRKKYTH